MRSPHRPLIESLESRRLYSSTLADVGDVPPAGAADTRPNIVLILSDDQDLQSVQYMPRVQELLAGRGEAQPGVFTASVDNGDQTLTFEVLDPTHG